MNIGFSKTVVDKKVQQILVRTGGLFIVFLGLTGVAFSVLMTRFVTTPVHSLMNSMKAFETGNFDERAPILTHDELGQLAQTFNSMGQQLQTSFQQRQQVEERLQHVNKNLERLVEERTAQITRQTYILDTFMENVPDSIYFKDLESLFIRANQALTTLVGLDDPAEMVGKSDFDFFSEEHARPKYEQEQEILRTGHPILAQEEAHVGGTWALTTKMPLRDEHGAIIGTFGISRDITPLKEAQRDLAVTYEEIRSMNEQLKEENLRMVAELDVARRLQMMVLPSPEELQHVPGIDIACIMQPADEVGGDYYDVLTTNDTVHIGIGDVTGHGLESGILMLMTQTAIRTLIEHGETDPVIFLATVNRTLYKNIQRIRADKSLTAAFVNYRHGQLTIVGQHEELLVVRSEGNVERVDTKDLGFPLGLVSEIGDWLASAAVTLEPGDGFVLYTDGITEAESPACELYGLERLCRVVGQHWQAASSEAVQQAVIADIMRHISNQKVYDDITLVVVKLEQEETA